MLSNKATIKLEGGNDVALVAGQTFTFTTDQLFWLAALPGLSGATLRVFYSFIVPIFGGRRWTALSTASLLLPALWMGIFYDSQALAAAWDLCKDWKIEDHEGLRADVARRGLKAEISGRTVQDVAKDLLAISRSGLKNRNRLSGGLVDETGYLSELDQIADSGVTPAERLLELYNTRWAGDAGRAFEDFAY